MSNEITFEVSIGLIEEMAECIYCCNWVSQEEIAAYMKGCITNSEYEPEDWSVDREGLISKNRSVIIEQGESK